MDDWTLCLWTKDKSDIGTAIKGMTTMYGAIMKGRVNITATSDTCVLAIKSVKVADGGSYQCQVAIMVAVTKSDVAKLSVAGK